MSNDTDVQPSQITSSTLKHYKDGMAEWAEAQLPGKDLIALGPSNSFLVGVRKLCGEQYAVVDLTNGRFKIVSTIREAIEEYFGRVAWAVGALNLEEWENRFFDQKELNQRLTNWHSHVRRSLCENTETWAKEERARRVNIVLGILALLILPISLYGGVDLRLGIALGLIGAVWAWLRVRNK